MSLFAGTAALTDGMLVSTDDFFEWIGVSGPSTEETNRAQTAIEIATGVVRARTNRFLSETTETITLDGLGGGLLQLPEYPVTAIGGIQEDGTSLTETDDYTWNALGVVLRVGACWPVSQRGIEVTYTHGYTNLPREIAGVCLALSKRLYDNVGGQAIQSEQIGAYQVTYSDQTGGGIGLEGWEADVLSRYASVL